MDNKNKYYLADASASASLLAVIAFAACTDSLLDYGQCWGIETLFSMFKTRGYYLGRLTSPTQTVWVSFWLCYYWCWAMITGVWGHRQRFLSINKHGRLSKSIFRYGFNYLRSIIQGLDLKSDAFSRSLQVLSCT